MRPLVILHGWSDDSRSFERLAADISRRTGRAITQVFLGDYVSMDDDVRMVDIVRALSRAWRQTGLPVEDNSVDVIVHSTGGLVIRDWMHSEWFARDKRPPVNNLVMLAPANFGSPLAHKGRSFYGRAIKGFGSDNRFETGTHVLKALEMASPYSWQLAEHDRFARNVFSSGGVRATVIIGNSGYEGISSIANENGSDGTVYLAAANLNCARLVIDFAARPERPKLGRLLTSQGDTGFLVIEGLNHSTVARKIGDEDLKSLSKKARERALQGADELLGAIEQALEVNTRAEFSALCARFAAATEQVMDAHSRKRDSYKHGYQNSVFRVRDNEGFDVSDYVIEFYQDCEDWKDKVAVAFNRDALQKVHAYQDNPSLRSFMINCTRMAGLIDKPDERLKISLSALPAIGVNNNVVGYRSFGNDDIGAVELSPAEIPPLFQRNRTVFVDIVLRREQLDEVFRIRPAGGA